MRHPNIVNLRGIFETKDILIIEMDFCRFGNLNQLLKQRGGQLGDEEASQVMRSLLKAINYVHQ